MDNIKIKIIKELIDKKDLYEFHSYLEFNGIDVNSIPKDKIDPLTYAIESHSSDKIIQFLIEKYHNTSYETNDGKIPIFCAIENQNYKISDYLLKRNKTDGTANLNYINQQNQNILEYLFNRKKLSKKTLYYCIKRGVIVNDEKGSLLVKIIESHQEGFEDIIKTLFYNIIYTNEFIIRLITMGKTQKSLGIQQMQKLVDKEKSKISITKKVYKSVIDNGCINLLNILFNHDIHFNIKTKTFDIIDGYGLLLRALLFNQYDIVNYLIQYGINKNKVYKNIFTPLTYAAYTHIDQVKFLVERGADINVTDGYGHTPLMIAAGYGKYDTVRYLVEQGADIHLKNIKGYNALLISSKYGQFQIVKYLIEKGANLYEKNNKGDNAFLLCLRHDDINMVKFFLEKGVDINEKDNKGYNAVMLSAYFGYLDLTEYLIENNINLYEKDNDGLTVIDFATKGEHMAIVQYLVRYMKQHPKKDDDSHRIKDSSPNTNKDGNDIKNNEMKNISICSSSSDSDNENIIRNNNDGEDNNSGAKNKNFLKCI